MNPEKISAVDMGYIFENLVQRFSESYDEEAGAHFTSRDIIYLMCDLLTDRMGMANEGRMYTAYEGTDIERAVNIIIWSMEGFAAKEQAKLKAHSVTELHFNEILSEMDLYFELLRTCFYR